MTERNKFSDVMQAAWRQMPTLIAFSFMVNILLLVSSIYMLQIFDRVLSSGSVDTLIWLTVIAVSAIAIYGLLEQSRRRMLTRIGSWLEIELSPAVIRRSIRAKLQMGRSEASLGDVADIRGFVGGDAVLAFLDAPWTPVFLAIIWLMHPYLGLIAVAGALILFSFALLNDRLTRTRQSEASMEQRRSHAAAQSYTAAAETASPLGMCETLIRRWSAAQTEARAEKIGVADTNAGFYNVSRSVRLALQVAILGAGAALVLQTELTPGGMIAASIILSRALSPVERSITAWRSYVAFRGARTRLHELFAATRQTVESLELPRPKGALDIDSLRFLPPGGTEPILKKVDFKLAAGQVCGVIGPSGSGKSTLCKLLVGAWRPSFGSVRLDGADVAAWDPEKLGPNLGYLPQSIDLFRGTVADNIARMRDADDSEIIAAAKLAGAHEMILKLPNGYDTEVGLQGELISGGQKQRIGLARALFREPSFLVLDEPNSNLDGDGELALMRGLAAMKKRGCTMVIVAHQPNLLRAADRVLVLREGVSAAIGPRDEVLKSLMKTAKTPGSIVPNNAPAAQTSTAASGE